MQDVTTKLGGIWSYASNMYVLLSIRATWQGPQWFGVRPMAWQKNLWGERMGTVTRSEVQVIWLRALAGMACLGTFFLPWISAQFAGFRRRIDFIQLVHGYNQHTAPGSRSECSSEVLAIIVALFAAFVVVSFIL